MKLAAISGIHWMACGAEGSVLGVGRAVQKGRSVLGVGRKVSRSGGVRGGPRCGSVEGEEELKIG